MCTHASAQPPALTKLEIISYIIKMERNEPDVRIHHLAAEAQKSSIPIWAMYKTVSGKHDRSENIDNPKVEGNQTTGRQPHRIVQISKLLH